LASSCLLWIPIANNCSPVCGYLFPAAEQPSDFGDHSGDVFVLAHFQPAETGGQAQLVAQFVQAFVGAGQAFAAR